jgi:hypothetical protein
MMGVDVKTLKTLRNEKGMAMIEAVPLLVMFVVLLSFSLGFFGVIHTAILNSISARAYAFETFRDRTNLNFFREDGSALKSLGPLWLGTKGFRYHAIQNENDRRSLFIPTTRTIAVGKEEPEKQTSRDTHNQQIYTIQDRQANTRVDVNPVWVMVGYGICLNAACGE